MISCLLLVVLQSGCFTIGLEATDAISAKAAEEEDPQQEANEGAVEHAIEEAGKATQKGVHKIKEVKHKAVEKAKDALD